MARANPTMDIEVHSSMVNHPKVQEWTAKGHRIRVYAGTDVDVSLLPFGHQWTDVDWDYSDAMLAAARARRKKKGKA